MKLTVNIDRRDLETQLTIKDLRELYRLLQEFKYSDDDDSFREFGLQILRLRKEKEKK